MENRIKNQQMEVLPILTPSECYSEQPIIPPVATDTPGPAHGLLSVKLATSFHSEFSQPAVRLLCPVGYVETSEV